MLCANKTEATNADIPALLLPSLSLWFLGFGTQKLNYDLAKLLSLSSSAK